MSSPRLRRPRPPAQPGQHHLLRVGPPLGVVRGAARPPRPRPAPARPPRPAPAPSPQSAPVWPGRKDRRRPGRTRSPAWPSARRARPRVRQVRVVRRGQVADQDVLGAAVEDQVVGDRDQAGAVPAHRANRVNRSSGLAGPGRTAAAPRRDVLVQAGVGGAGQRSTTGERRQHARPGYQPELRVTLVHRAAQHRVRAATTAAQAARSAGTCRSAVEPQAAPASRTRCRRAPDPLGDPDAVLRPATPARLVTPSDIVRPHLVAAGLGGSTGPVVARSSGAAGGRRASSRSRVLKHLPAPGCAASAGSTRTRLGQLVPGQPVARKPAQVGQPSPAGAQFDGPRSAGLSSAGPSSAGPQFGAQPRRRPLTGGARAPGAAARRRGRLGHRRVLEQRGLHLPASRTLNAPDLITSRSRSTRWR